MTNGDVYAALDHHVSAFWPNNTQEAFTWDKGPISDRIPGFHVRRVTPNAATEPWVYVSIGASTVVNKYGNEYFILSPIESARHIETLAMVAHFQSFEAHTAGGGQPDKIRCGWRTSLHAQNIWRPAQRVQTNGRLPPNRPRPPADGRTDE